MSDFDAGHWEMRCHNWGRWNAIDTGEPERMRRPPDDQAFTPDTRDAEDLDRAMCEIKFRQGIEGRMLWALMHRYYTHRLHEMATPWHALDDYMWRRFRRPWRYWPDPYTGIERAEMWIDRGLRRLADAHAAIDTKRAEVV